MAKANVNHTISGQGTAFSTLHGCLPQDWEARSRLGVVWPLPEKQAS